MERQGKGFFAADIPGKAIFTVNKIAFGYMVMLDKDNPGTYLSVPVWDFIGSAQMGETGSETVYPSNKNAQYSILTINAINGAIVDRNSGY